MKQQHNGKKQLSLLYATRFKFESNHVICQMSKKYSNFSSLNVNTVQMKLLIYMTELKDTKTE